MTTYIMPLRKMGIIALLLTCIVGSSDARTYYSRQSGLWTVASSWSTVTYGNATNTGTYPGRGDVVYIGDGHNITMNVNAVTASITVGQGTSGTLMYSNYLTFLMVIAGDLTVNSGATFGYSANSSKMHSCYISGSLINNGTVDLYYDANDYVNLTFNSRINSIVSGTGAFDLNTVTLYKSTLNSYRLEVTASAFESAVRNLVVTYGTYVHNNAGTYSVNPTGGSQTVSPDAIFEVMSGVLHLSPNDDYVYLQGQLNVVGGTMRIGSSSGNQGLRFDQSGTVVPGVTVTGGTLNVYGGITYRSGNSTDPFRFSQSGGTVTLNNGSTGTANEVFLVSNNVNSRFTMSGGTITLQRATSGGTSISDFDICGSSGTVTVTGGTVYFGNGTTVTGTTFNFTPYSGVIMPNMRVSGALARSITLRPSNNSTSDCNFLSLYLEFNKSFDVRSIAGTTGDSRNLTLSGTYDGVNAYYNVGTFTPRTGTVTFGGSSAQTLAGTATTTFYNLTINNAAGVSLARTANVSGTLMMSNGILSTSAVNPIVCIAGANANIGSSVSYIDGPMQQIVASISPQSINFPIGKTGAFRPIILAVQHSDASSVTYTSEAWNISARGMGYTLPPSLRWVSDIRYYSITRTSVANLSNARVTLSYGADDYVNDYNNLRVARDDGSSSWLDLGGSGTANVTGSITSSNFTGFNTYFTLANNVNGVNPLPVEFISFTGAAKNTYSALNWVTASETNSDYYTVERSTDGVNFSPIGRVIAKGFTTVVTEYNFNDLNPSSGYNYYRLHQVDRNGDFEYSSIVMVYFNKSVLNVYPNPVSNGELTIALPDPDMSAVEARVFDLSGKQILVLPVNYTEGNSSSFQIGNELQPGTYILQVADGVGQTWQEKIVIAL